MVRRFNSCLPISEPPEQVKKNYEKIGKPRVSLSKVMLLLRSFARFGADEDILEELVSVITTESSSRRVNFKQRALLSLTTHEPPNGDSTTNISQPDTQWITLRLRATTLTQVDIDPR